MSDFADSATDVSDHYLALALRQHANRKPEPLPECSECEEFPIHVTATGVRHKYCLRCENEMKMERI